MVNFNALIAVLWAVPSLAIVAMLAIRRPAWAEFLNLASALVIFGLTLAILVAAPNHAVVTADQ